MWSITALADWVLTGEIIQGIEGKVRIRGCTEVCTERERERERER
jgi:hypothetical protein